MDFWTDLPTWLRALVGLGFIGLAVLLFFATGGTRIAVGIGAIGLVMVLFCNIGNDNSGYRF
jgi:hypothetical protein